MIGLIRAEWVKLRTVRSNIVLIVITMIIPLAVSLLTAALKNVRSFDSGSVARPLIGASTPSVLVLGVLGVMVMSQEHSQGTIRITFAATPQRMRVLLAKALVTMLTSVAVMGTALLIGSRGGVAIAGARDVPTSGLLDGLPAPAAAILAMSALVSLLGLAVGAITRTPPVAITLLVLWPTLLEGLLHGLVLVTLGESARKWVPFNNAMTATFPEAFELDFGRVGSIAYFGVWVLAISAIASVVTRRRDA